MEIFQKDYYQANAILDKVQRMLDICEERGQNPKNLVTVSLLEELSDLLSRVDVLNENILEGKVSILIRKNELRKRQRYLIGLFNSSPAENSFTSKDSIIFVGNRIISAL